MKNTLINLDCMEWLPDMEEIDTLFADPPDNQGLGYDSYNDKLSTEQYVGKLQEWLACFVAKAKTVWFSYNARWTFEVGRIVCALQESYGKTLTVKPCIQTYTFGQHNHHDLGNNHRPLIRFQWASAPLYPDAIRVPSWRQENGDKRADPRGRVPGDVFDFTRVVGNSKQRRTWHPTQLNEGLVERCLKMTTPAGGNVVDPFGGTGTTLRVCKQLGYNCTLFEIDKGYCEKIAAEHGLVRTDYCHRAVWEGA
jgi:site-specific DNA-methyltransferase (adenine-specific)